MLTLLQFAKFPKTLSFQNFVSCDMQCLNDSSLMKQGYPSIFCKDIYICPEQTPYIYIISTEGTYYTLWFNPISIYPDCTYIHNHLRFNSGLHSGVLCVMI